MSFKKKLIHFISILLLLFSSILIGIVPHILNDFKETLDELKKYIILKQNKQSKYILEGIKYCTIKFIDLFQNKMHLNLTMGDINKIVDYCAAKHRSAGPTGDYFSIWDYCPKFGAPCFGGDNSPDCQGYSNTRTVYDELIWQKPAKKFIKKYIKENNITDARLLEMTKPDHWIWWDDVKYIKTHYPNLYKQLHDTSKPNKLRIIMHNKPELAYKILTQMLNFFDSDVNKVYYWQFDNSKEYLQWVIVRSHDTNVWGQKVKITSTPNNMTAKYGRLLIAIGFQEDELFDPQFVSILDRLQTLFDNLAQLSFIMGAFTLILAFILNIIVFTNGFYRTKEKTIK